MAAGAFATSLLPQDREVVSLRLRGRRKRNRFYQERELVDQIERQESYSVSWAWKHPRVAPIKEIEYVPVWDNLRGRWVLPHR